MSTETPERAHDPARRPPDGDGEPPRDGDDLVVVVCPNRVYEQLRPEIDAWRGPFCRAYEREYEDLLAERARLADEVDALERRLRRKETQLDAVVARNEQVLADRTESYRERLAGEEPDDDFEWTDRRQEAGLLARLRSWLR